MPPPHGPVPAPSSGPSIGLDPTAAAAAAAARALDDLASTLQAVARADADRVTAAAADWDGFTRGWFDHHHAEAALALRQAARQAARAAVAVRQAAIATGATP